MKRILQLCWVIALSSCSTTAPQSSLPRHPSTYVDARDPYGDPSPGIVALRISPPAWGGWPGQGNIEWLITCSEYFTPAKLDLLLARLDRKYRYSIRYSKLNSAGAIAAQSHVILQTQKLQMSARESAGNVLYGNYVFPQPCLHSVSITNKKAMVELRSQHLGSALHAIRVELARTSGLWLVSNVSYRSPSGIFRAF